MSGREVFIECRRAAIIVLKALERYFGVDSIFERR